MENQGAQSGESRQAARSGEGPWRARRARSRWREAASTMKTEQIGGWLWVTVGLDRVLAASSIVALNEDPPACLAPPTTPLPPPYGSFLAFSRRMSAGRLSPLHATRRDPLPLSCWHPPSPCRHPLPPLRLASPSI